MASTSREMPPKTYEGLKPSYGNMKPVTLVSTVVVKKIAVQPSRRLLLSRPNRTTKPDPIPARLMITCNSVKVESDMPRSMVYVLSGEFSGTERLETKACE